MKKVLMQYQHQGEKFEIWNTELDDLQQVWLEMGLEQPTEPGLLYFEDNPVHYLIVNGGF